MRPCAYTNQSLLDHSIGSYREAVKLVSDNYYRVTAKRLERMGITLTVEEVKDLVKEAVLLHDIGKAGEYYQEQYDDECNAKVKTPSFMYHEIGSALFFYYNKEVKKEVRELLALAAINHLNAIRGIGDFEDPLKMPSDFKNSMLKMEKYGSVLLDSLRREGLITRDFTVKDYKFEDFSDMLIALAKKNVTAKYLKLYNLFLAPVMVGDNLNSSFVRNSSSVNERKTRFVKLLEDEINANSTL